MRCSARPETIPGGARVEMVMIIRRPTLARPICRRGIEPAIRHKGDLGAIGRPRWMARVAVGHPEAAPLRPIEVGCHYLPGPVLQPGGVNYAISPRRHARRARAIDRSQARPTGIDNVYPPVVDESYPGAVRGPDRASPRFCHRMHCSSSESIVRIGMGIPTSEQEDKQHDIEYPVEEDNPQNGEHARQYLVSPLHEGASSIAVRSFVSGREPDAGRFEGFDHRVIGSQPPG